MEWSPTNWEGGSPALHPHLKEAVACSAALLGLVGQPWPCKRVELGCTPVAQHLLQAGQEHVLHKRRTHFLSSALQKEK